MAAEQYDVALPVDESIEGADKENAELQLEHEDKFRLFHLKAVIISGVGFYTDAYDLQVISSVQTQMAMARWPGQVNAAYQGDLNQHGVVQALINIITAPSSNFQLS